MEQSELVVFGLGLGLLLVGAEILVRGATRLAEALRIAPLVIGLTVVAFGTSSPELAAAVVSARAGAADLALGNVVGSNLFNILVVLGLAAFVSPLIVQRKLIRLDVPIMLAVTAVIPVLAIDGGIERTEGLLLSCGLLLYLVFLFWEARREDPGELRSAPGGSSPLPLAGLFVLAGLAMLTLGAKWLVEAATSIARSFGVSELVIGLTLVAAGTSLPELATSFVASLRGQRDIAVGNVVGSNLFNLLGVLGITAMVSPHGVAVAEAARGFDLPFLLAVTVACLPVFITGVGIDRWEGALFVALYAFYATQLYVLARAGVTPSPTIPIAAVLGGVGVLSVTGWLRRRFRHRP